MFKVIPEYPNYACSQNGDMINIKTGRILSKSINQKGYVQHCISINGKRKVVFPHRFVAELFVDNPENKNFVNHIDGNPQNNNYKNLEWCTNSENILHAIHTLNKDLAKNKRKKVKCIETNVVYESTVAAEKDLGIGNAWISSICNGRKKSAKGLHFQYV